MSQVYTLAGISGQAVVAQKFLSDGRVGRVDFQIRHISGTAVAIIVSETNDAGVDTDIAGPTTLQPGGVISLSVASGKPGLSIKSGSGNTGQAFVHISPNFLGAFNNGNLGLDTRLGRSGFTGADIPGQGP